MSDDVSNGDHATWLDAIESDDGFYLECPNGHAWIPPRRVCKTCGSETLDRVPLSTTGRIVTYTEIHVPAPRFEHRDRVVVAIADFGGVSITGRLDDAATESIEQGTAVELDVEQSASTDERIVTFHPR
ncbi:OB-fold domain-containing protein [Haloferax sp. AB510]|uniref:Zn-ribbon domain-containing OB-fold protein n=1 Tax=Haloferax sp. AB510 TaxID=2934172 RepID=UPI00209C64C5|nr:OB-fold domain-containing protein [Haloferax sp. AB510]MCO8268789.1 OB-fold domain-containing protein [Haloferax sp. AB510]